MEPKTNDPKEKHPDKKFPKDPESQTTETSAKKIDLIEIENSNSHETGSISQEEEHWLEFENCLRDIDKNYESPENIAKIRASPAHIESLKQLVRVFSQITGIKEDYQIQIQQDEIVYLFKTGKNEYEFFKLFDFLLRTCEPYILSKRGKATEKGELSEAEAKMIKDQKRESIIKQTDDQSTLINDMISANLNLAIIKIDEKFSEVNRRTQEIEKRVLEISKSLKKIQKKIQKQNKLKISEKFEAKTLSLPYKRRRFSTVESFSFKPKFIQDSEDSDSSKGSDSFGSTCQDQSLVLEKDNDLEDMIFKLRLRGSVKMTDIWRLNNFAVIFNIYELKGILDLGKIDDLTKLKPWASRWKAKDKYFSNMKKVASPSYSRNITKYESSLAGIAACLTEYYLFHFDLYCTWRKLKLWLKNISNPIDLCITPSYPHRIRSVIADEGETGFAFLLEKAVPYLTKQRLERTPNLILYSFIDDFPDDYLMKSQYCISGRHQHIDLRKILNVGHS